MADYMKIRDAVTDSCEFGPGHYKTPQALIKDGDQFIGCIGVDYLDNFKKIVLYAGFSEAKDIRKLRNLISEHLPEATIEFPVFNDLPMAACKGPFVYARTYMDEILALDMLDRLETVIERLK